MSGELNCHKQKLWKSDMTDAKPPLPGAKKHPDFRVTSCHYFDTIIINFAYTESE